MRNFQHLLHTLREALQDARRQLSSQPQVSSDKIESERSAFVGDFVHTLDDCRALLSKTARLRHQDGTTQQQDSQKDQRLDDLRSHLHCHAQKIRLVLDRLSIDLHARTDSFHGPDAAYKMSYDMRLELIQLRSSLFGHIPEDAIPDSQPVGDAHPTSPNIAKRLHAAYLVNAPPGSDVAFPLMQGFDILLFHFEQGTSHSDHTPEKYLSFLKARWLLDRLMASREFQETEQVSCCKHAVHRIVQAIAARTSHSSLLLSYEEATLMSLPESAFGIWPSISPVRTIHQAEETSPLSKRANEEFVARMPLASDDTITVFKSSGERFRVVMESSNQGGKTFIPQPIHTHDDKLVPRYALPGLLQPALEMAVISRNEEVLYTFGNLQSLYNFQSVLMGYEVSHDQAGIRCQFSDNVGFLDCTARVQLWQEPISSNNPGSDTQTLPGGSIRSPSSISERTERRAGSLAPSFATASSVHWTDEGGEAEGVKVSAITMFTKLRHRRKDRLAVISIDLEHGVALDPRECKCSRDYDSCLELVMTKPKGRKNAMTVRVLYTETDSSGQPDTSTFDLLPFRLPRHPRYDKLTAKKTEYLLLRFSTVQEKRRFEAELQLRFQIRDVQMQNQLDFAANTRRLEAEYTGAQESAFRSNSLAPSVMSSSLSTYSLPSKVDLTQSDALTRDAPIRAPSERTASVVELAVTGNYGDVSKTHESSHGRNYGVSPPAVVELTGSTQLSELAASPAVSDAAAKPPDYFAIPRISEMPSSDLDISRAGSKGGKRRDIWKRLGSLRG